MQSAVGIGLLELVCGYIPAVYASSFGWPSASVGDPRRQDILSGVVMVQYGVRIRPLDTAMGDSQLKIQRYTCMPYCRDLKGVRLEIRGTGWNLAILPVEDSCI